MNKEEVIDKIRKVYNKSKNNPNYYESKEAVLKVQQLLAKYNLSMNDLGLKEKEKDNVKEIKTGEKSRTWHLNLARAISKNFRCKLYYLTGRGTTIVFIGRDIDVNICFNTYEYMKKSINYNCKIHISKRRLRKKESISNAKKSFIDGFLMGLEHELNKQKTEWGIVLSIPSDVINYYSNIRFKGSLTIVDEIKKYDERAYQDGYIKGRETDINPDKILI